VFGVDVLGCQVHDVVHRQANARNEGIRLRHPKLPPFGSCNANCRIDNNKYARNRDQGHANAPRDKQQNAECKDDGHGDALNGRDVEGILCVHPWPAAGGDEHALQLLRTFLLEITHSLLPMLHLRSLLLCYGILIIVIGAYGDSGEFYLAVEKR